MRSSQAKHSLLPAVGTVGRNKRSASAARPLAAVTRLDVSGGLISISAQGSDEIVAAKPHFVHGRGKVGKN
jgi:hypothetical protein